MKKKLIIVLFIISPVLVYLICDIFYYYPEKHKIKSFTVELFDVKDTISYNSCLLLAPTKYDSISFYSVLGFHFNYEFESVEHEHVLFGEKHADRGQFGNLDTIKNITCSLNSNFVINDSLISANIIKQFRIEGIENIDGHNICENQCYCFPVTPNNLIEYIENYNYAKFTFADKRNYLFFRITNSMKKQILAKGLFVKIEFKDKSVIEGRVLR